MQRRFIHALFLFLLSAGAVAQAAQNGSQSGNQAPTQSPFEEAQDLAARGRLDQAISQLDELAKQTPEPAGVERLRGIIFYQKDQLSAAVEAFRKAAAEDPNDRESIEMQGVSLFRLGKSSEAIPFLEKAHASVERANVDPQYVLGLCYADAQRYDAARHAFAAQYGFGPDSAEAYLLAGRLFLRRELAAEAANQARTALQVNPGLPLAHQLLGEVALAKGDVPGAVRELEAERKD